MSTFLFGQTVYYLFLLFYYYIWNCVPNPSRPAALLTRNNLRDLLFALRTLWPLIGDFRFNIPTYKEAHLTNQVSSLHPFSEKKVRSKRKVYNTNSYSSGVNLFNSFTRL